MMAKEPYLVTPKSLHKNGPKTFEMASMAGVPISRFETIIKGSKVGRITLNHKSSPELAPLNTGCGNRSIRTKSAMTQREVKYRFMRF
ncbi:hypothetical protein CE91St59_18710 [[Clostridium] scindens]|nr:hypothetical protein CE91St59_18710 [[Clostridium] scindens]BDF20307.1 hypothetical protein CE91St60_18900 [[Clostridium] scindens]